MEGLELVEVVVGVVLFFFKKEGGVFSGVGCNVVVEVLCVFVLLVLVYLWVFISC